MNKLLYLFVNYGSAGLQFLLLPLFVAAVGQYEFGLFTFMLAIANWLSFAGTLGTQTKLRKTLGSDCSRKRSADINTTLIIAFTLVLAVVISSGAYFYLFTDFNARFGFSTLIFVVCYCFFSITNSFLIANNRMIVSALNQFCYSIFPICLFLLFTPGLSSSYRFLFASFIMAVFIFFNRKLVFQELSLRNLQPVQIYFDSFVDNVKIAANSLFDKIISQGDKLIVGSIFGFEILAVYAVGSQISNISQMTINAFSVYAEQNIFKKSSELKASIILTLIIGALTSIILFYAVKFFFLNFFDVKFKYVLELLPLQLGIVYIRAMSSLLFVADLNKGEHLRNISIQYTFLLLGFGILILFSNLMSIISFLYVLLSIIILSVLVNFIYRSFKK
ncbi:lipopolysaccharide biosynthesis protein [Psychrobium sp. nBUS_13]|uniref:lipopolysaccharide biosynthesis protein n=1 Tax=Psychrobium sp. nBUS_13 TaxID=3395319 RepID=UPI003EBF611F